MARCFFFELASRAWDQFVVAVGTTTLGFVIGLVVLPVVLHLLRVLRGKASMKLGDFMDTAFGVLAVYGIIYFSVLIFGVPKQIRDQARAIPAPTYFRPFPPFYWEEKTHPTAPVGPEIQISWSTTDEIREGKTITFVSMTVDHPMDIPAFLATCDRPCKSLGASVEGYSRSTDLAANNNPNVAGTVLITPRPLGAGLKVQWAIQSLDGSSVKITRLHKLLQSQLPADLR
jgi:hypothetical protein